MREVSLRGSAVGNTEQIRELVQMVRVGKLKLPAVQVRPLAEAEGALRDLEAGRIIGRVVLDTAEATA
jgi:propanol-preferring alcohol dehydrogenase